MRKKEFFVVEKKKSPLKKFLIAVGAVAAVFATIAIAYKLVIDKCKSEILGRVDINGDGEADAIMLDTTGDGEVDTIIINTESENEDEE